VPLAAVLWNGGISFGGVTAFIFADLLILPILNIYRKYYGARMTLTLLGVFYLAMAGAGYLVEILFGATGLTPKARNAMVMTDGIRWNYTTWLNIVFLVLAAILVIRFVRTGGIPMLRMMGGSPDADADADAGHDHAGHGDGGQEHGGHEHAGHQHAGQEHAGQEHAGHGHAGHESGGREHMGRE